MSMFRRNRIAIMREAITKVTKTLANMDIEVTQRGDQAYVAYDTSTPPKPISLNVPYLPDNAPEKVINAVQGFLDHEVAHILFSDANAIAEGAEESKHLGMMHNIVEDCWIEYRMAEKFKGSAHNLSNTRLMVFREKLEPMYQEVVSEGGQEADFFKILQVVMFRALAGHQECLDYMDEGDKWRHLPTVLKAIDFFAGDFKLCNDSFDTLKLARKILDALKNLDEAQDNDSSSDDAGDEPGDSGDQSGEDQSKGGGGSESRGEEQGPGDDSGDESEGDPSSGGSEDNSDDDRDADGSGGAGKGDSKDGGQDDTDASGDDPVKGDGDKGEKGEGDIEAENQDSTCFIDALDDPLDIQKAISANITEVYMDLTKHKSFGKWLIFSRDQNTLGTYQVSSGFDTSATTKMIDEVGSMIGPMAKTLERLVLAQTRHHFEPGKRSGRLNTNSLHRLGAGDARVFRKKITSRAKDTAAEVVIDLSGSMSGQNIKTAMYSAYALTMTLERIRIPTEVFGFTTGSPSQEWVNRLTEAEGRIGRRYSVRDAARHHIFKGFEERMRPDVVNRFGDMVNDGNNIMYANCDPESVLEAGLRLSRRPEARKIMMVLSDGWPAFAGDITQSHKRLKKVVKELEASGVEVVGIGIQDDAVKKFYPKNVVIDRVSQLPGAMVNELRSILLK